MTFFLQEYSVIKSVKLLHSIKIHIIRVLTPTTPIVHITPNFVYFNSEYLWSSYYFIYIYIYTNILKKILTNTHMNFNILQ